MEYFISWRELKDAFIICFKRKKSDGEVIDNLSYLKQKKSDNVEEFFERIL